MDGQPQVAILLADEVAGIDPETGTLLWRHPHKTRAAWDQHAGLGAGQPALSLVGVQHRGARAEAVAQRKLDDRAGARYNPRVQSHFGSVIRQDGFVYLSSGQGVGLLTAVELQTGRVAWQVRDFVKAQLLGADGTPDHPR